MNVSMLETDTVEYNSKLYEVKVKNGLKTLKLYNIGIEDITNIKGLDKLTDLQVLNLAGNLKSNKLVLIAWFNWIIIS